MAILESNPAVTNFVLDLTTGYPVPTGEIVQSSDITVYFKAEDCQGNVIDLDDVDQIKVVAKKRHTSLDDPIFTASIATTKVSIIDAATGRFDVVLLPADTDFVGDADVQILYVMDDARVVRSKIFKILFKPKFVDPD